MTIELYNYIQNPNNAKANFELGLFYENIGQTGAAISFYLRTAEKSQTDIEQYESLLRCALCFETQGTRNNTVKVLFQRAISLIPIRPEAYFLLSRLHEANSEWQDSYMIACVGLAISKFDSEPLKSDVQYPNKYALLFQKGVSAWWVGLFSESREIMADLKFNYNMNSLFYTAVQNNLKNLGYPNTVIRYDSSLIDKIRFKFNDIESIDKNYSQSMQDMFVLSMLNGKKYGRYLEIGSAEPFINNNTALLEKQFDWTGISIDINKSVVSQFKKERVNDVFCLDATQIDYAEFLKEKGFTEYFDYLQIDCDPPSISLKILKSIPFDKYKFATITFEHDFYIDPTVKEESRKYLISKGYVLCVSDIAYNQINSYEDWWVHPDLVDVDILLKMQEVSPSIKFVKNYMLSK